MEELGGGRARARSPHGPRAWAAAAPSGSAAPMRVLPAGWKPLRSARPGMSTTSSGRSTSSAIGPHRWTVRRLGCAPICSRWNGRRGKPRRRSCGSIARWVCLRFAEYDGVEERPVSEPMGKRLEFPAGYRPSTKLRDSSAHKAKHDLFASESSRALLVVETRHNPTRQWPVRTRP